MKTNTKKDCFITRAVKNVKQFFKKVFVGGGLPPKDDPQGPI